MWIVTFNVILHCSPQWHHYSRVADRHEHIFGSTTCTALLLGKENLSAWNYQWLSFLGHLLFYGRYQSLITFFERHLYSPNWDQRPVSSIWISSWWQFPTEHFVIFRFWPHFQGCVIVCSVSCSYLKLNFTYHGHGSDSIVTTVLPQSLLYLEF